MVITRIHPSLTERLTDSPETGMGYQILDVSLKPNLSGYVLVQNAEVAIEAKEHKGFKALMTKVLEMGVEGKLMKALSETPDKVNFRILSLAQAVSSGLIDRKSEETKEGPASEAIPQMSVPPERFLRYSAFENDRRINSDGSVKPGTYTTTYSDGTTHVSTGMDAVRRYALPNPLPAVNKFELQPPGPIKVRRGRVAPAYGQPGGGKEVIFDNGASAGTLKSKSKIPPGT